MSEICPTCGNVIGDKRSNNANRYYWGVILPPICEATGFTAIELHDIFKLMFNKQLKEFNGFWFEYGATTTTMTIKEFNEFIKQVEQYAAQEFGIEYGMEI